MQAGRRVAENVLQVGGLELEGSSLDEWCQAKHADDALVLVYFSVFDVPARYADLTTHALTAILTTSQPQGTSSQPTTDEIGSN